MLLVGPNNHTVEIDDRETINKFINQKDYREAKPDEIEAYKLRVQEAIERQNQVPQSDGVYFQTVQSGPDGYGMSRDFIKNELRRLDIKMQENYLDQKVGLLYSYPYGITQLKTDVRIIYTMFESDEIPPDWAEYLQAADEVLVPSKWCSDVFLKAGIKTTIVPLGYNHRAFHFIERQIPVDNEKPFTFIHYDSFNIRKGFFEVLEAFSKEFKKNEPVKLILKTAKPETPVPIHKSVYPNVEVIKERLTEEELLQLLARSNCMVYPSRGEGFGITPLEAMATGIPAIIPNAHGISEYFNSNYMLEVKVGKKTPGLYKKFKEQPTGEMIICDEEDLRKQMRYAYNHQSEMKDLGKQASDYVKRFTYERTAEQLKLIIQRWQTTEVIKRPDSNFLKVEEI